MKAPEKLYLPKRNKLPLEVVRGCEWFETDPQRMYGSVEYTRTDAFIEKACVWLEENADMYEAFDSESKSYYMDKDKLVEDFKKLFKEE